MLTNPNTLGLFEERIEEITEVLHSVGALVYYDGANLNAIMGKARPGDMGFDIVHINTHKTFMTPHGGEGRAPDRSGSQSTSSTTARPHRCPRRRRLVPMGPRPAEIDRPAARLQRNFGVLVRAYAYVFGHGGDGLTEVSELAALNANYLATRMAQAFPLAYPGSPPMHEFVATAEPLKRATGVRALDVAKRVIDLGITRRPCTSRSSSTRR